MNKQIREIKSFPGYLISNYGEVYSRWQRGPGSKPNGVLRRIYPVLASGRWQVGLSKGGKRHTRRVHALVLEAFVGPKPKGMEACHYPDSDTSNNRLDNLRWDTKSGNYHDRISHGTCNTGERNGSAKLRARDIPLIRADHKAGKIYADIAKDFSVSISAVQQVCEFKTWKQIKE